MLNPTSTHFPYTTLFRSAAADKIDAVFHMSLEPDPILAPSVEFDQEGHVGRMRAVLKHFEFEKRIRHHQSSGGFSLGLDRKSTRLNSSHLVISYVVFCLK